MMKKNEFNEDFYPILNSIFEKYHSKPRACLMMAVLQFKAGGDYPFRGTAKELQVRYFPRWNIDNIRKWIRFLDNEGLIIKNDQRTLTGNQGYVITIPGTEYKDKLYNAPPYNRVLEPTPHDSKTNTPRPENHNPVVTQPRSQDQRANTPGSDNHKDTTLEPTGHDSKTKGSGSENQGDVVLEPTYSIEYKREEEGRRKEEDRKKTQEPINPYSLEAMGEPKERFPIGSCYQKSFKEIYRIAGGKDTDLISYDKILKDLAPILLELKIPYPVFEEMVEWMKGDEFQTGLLMQPYKLPYIKPGDNLTNLEKSYLRFMAWRNQNMSPTERRRKEREQETRDHLMRIKQLEYEEKLKLEKNSAPEPMKNVTPKEEGPDNTRKVFEKLADEGFDLLDLGVGKS
jgi:hypothetical protein